MAEDTNPGFLENARDFLASQADALKASASAALRQRAAEIREAIGPEKMEPVTQPERPFGRDEGGQDVSRVVWTGHTVQTPEGHAYFAAAGLTENGYYRAAEVQVYGPDELWRWQVERHADKEHAIASAETLAANRLAGEEARTLINVAAEPAWREVFGKEQDNMAELPEHVKKLADQARQESRMEKAEVKDMDAAKAVDNYGDGGKALETMREQKRQDAIQDKTPEPTPEPGR
jgi:hypothetical protein